MAKQTFTTGQVLTAAQMTSLQQTAMGGGSATAKTASYVLVAADAGGTVAMNAAGATTITVNTGLFAAGDTVFIQNLGAGNCVVTAGTATVSTAGSLTLPQYDAGILYFTATGAAIFYDYVQGGGSASPLTTKGDVYTFSTSDARLGVGANGTVLTAASGEATGLSWAAPTAAAFEGCRLTFTGTQSCANTVQTILTWNVEDYKTTAAFHSTSTNTSRITIPTGLGGYYLINAMCSWDNVANRKIIYLFKNGAEVTGAEVGQSGTSPSIYFATQITAVLSLSAGDYVEVAGYQNSGGSANAQAFNQFGVAKL